MFNTIEQAINDIRNGKMIIVVDDEHRENEGDLIMAADMITAEHVNFMTQYGRGLVCAAVSSSKAEKLGFQRMVSHNTALHETAFTVSVDVNGSGTGISAFARAKTIKAIASDVSKVHDFMRPGHIFPLIAADHGVLERNGHTEAAVDLSKLAGYSGSGVLCEILSADGTMAQRDELVDMAKKHDMSIITIKDLVLYRKRVESTVVFKEKIKLPTMYGEFDMYVYENRYEPSICHFALVNGFSDIPLTRVHSECLTGDMLGSLRCDCGDQLHTAMKAISEHGGVLVYLRQEGRGIGFLNKIRAYRLQENGYDTVDANIHLGFNADEREYVDAAHILRHLGVETVDLMTNNPEKIQGLEMYGISVRKRMSIEIPPNSVNDLYMSVKKEKMDHLLVSV